MPAAASTLHRAKLQGRSTSEAMNIQSLSTGLTISDCRAFVIAEILDNALAFCLGMVVGSLQKFMLVSLYTQM